jgi:hypothetical protein
MKKKTAIVGFEMHRSRGGYTVIFGIEGESMGVVKNMDPLKTVVIWVILKELSHHIKFGQKLYP